MIVKEDLVVWFKALESYKRIDIMCTLLNLCLPFELRFLGTCLEELGRRDAQDLRGAELRVNNPQEFVSDVGSFQNGQPTETKIRRKMALYLALMRACNRTGVNELYKTLDRWGDRDFSKFSDGDPLQELLLVYTMATNHPVFSFEQRLKCGEIYSKITSCKAHLNQQQPSPAAGSAPSPITTPLSTPTTAFAVPQTSPPPPFNAVPPGTAFQPPPLQPQLINPQQQIPNPIIMTFPPNQMIPTADPTTSLALSVESLPPHMAVPPALIQIPTDFSSPPPWQLRYQTQIFPLIQQIDTHFPPQATSPHLSQPSSPSHSRTGSPTRQPSSQMRNNRSHRNAPRPSAETTPPPLLQQPGTGTPTVYMANDIMQNMKNFEDINMDGAISQLHSLSLRNGYTRTAVVSANSSSLPRQHHKAWAPMSHHSHTTENQMRKTTTASESGGSSTGEASPPPDPSATALHGNANQTQSSGSLRNKQPLNLSRLNGGKQGGAGSSNNINTDFNNGGNAGTLVTSSSSGNLLLAHNFPPGYRPQQQRQTQQFQPPPQPNGELLFFLPATQPPVVVPARASPSSAAAPTNNKMVQSCFNCGSTTHTGLNCNEASMEDVTRNSVYKLDYTVSTAPQLQLVATAMSQEPVDTSITFIDLTQDTTSSSSSSSTSSIHGRKD